MKKVSLLLFALLFAVGCASSAADGSGSDSSVGSSMDKASATHYRLFSDPRHIRQLDWGNPPQGLHVKGRVTNRGFEAMSGVEGRGSLCADGKDFVTISDGLFHDASAGEAPAGPFVYGCKGMTGAFKPATREIQGL
jgi:hypothetical protein